MRFSSQVVYYWKLMFWKNNYYSILQPVLLMVFLLLTASVLKAHEAPDTVNFPQGTYVSQLITLLKATKLMQEIWIDYIIKRAGFYHETLQQLDRYPMLANLEYVGKARNYSYDFLAMQAVLCERYRNLLLKQQQEAYKDPEHEFHIQAFKNCVSLLYTKINETLVDLELKNHKKNK